MCHAELANPHRRLLCSPTLNNLKTSFNFIDIKETTDQNATAHCYVPMLKNVQAMRRAHLIDGAVPS